MFLYAIKYYKIGEIPLYYSRNKDEFCECKIRIVYIVFFVLKGKLFINTQISYLAVL